MTSVGGAVTPPERARPRQASSAVRSVLGIFNNLSIQIKASTASVLLLICLLGLGTNAYLTSTRTADGLWSLSNDLIPKQQAFSSVSEAVVATHMKIFRYVSWDSSGVSDSLLKPLHAEINRDLDTLSGRIAGLRPTFGFVQRRTNKHARTPVQMGDLQTARKGHDRCRSNRCGHGNDDAWPNGRYLQRRRHRVPKSVVGNFGDRKNS